MARQRPSYPSIRVRQRNIIEGLGTTDLRYAQAAKRFGVTPRELQHFVETKPRNLRSNFNRSPAYRKLYEEGARPQVREQLGIKRIRRYKFRAPAIREITLSQAYSPDEQRQRVQTGRAILNLYTEREHPQLRWALWTRERNLPTSIVAIKLLHRNNKIKDDMYIEAIAAWSDIYPNISDATYARYSLGEDSEVA